MAFFLANPMAEVANATDFPVGSPARVLIELTDEDAKAQEASGRLGEGGELPRGCHRNEAAERSRNATSDHGSDDRKGAF